MVICLILGFTKFTKHDNHDKVHDKNWTKLCWEIFWAKLLTPVLLGLSFVETSEHIALSFSFSTLSTLITL